MPADLFGSSKLREHGSVAEYTGLRHPPREHQWAQLGITKVAKSPRGEVIDITRIRPFVEGITNDLGDAQTGEHRGGFHGGAAHDLEWCLTLFGWIVGEQRPELTPDSCRDGLAGHLRTLNGAVELARIQSTPRLEDAPNLANGPSREFPLHPRNDLIAHHPQLLQQALIRHVGGGHGQDGCMRIVALSVFERIVYHCHCTDTTEPRHPTLVVDAIIRDGDADGPLLVTVADYKRMLGFTAARLHLPALRAAGRMTTVNRVEYLTFPLWQVDS